MRTLKKYSNRKIYDPTDSSYVTLNEIREFVKHREPFKVIDSKTGDDITASILIQIISELEGSSNDQPRLLTVNVLEELIRLYDDSMGSILAEYLEQSIKSYLEQRSKFKAQYDQFVQLNPQTQARDFTKTYMDFWKQYYSAVFPDKKS